MFNRLNFKGIAIAQKAIITIIDLQSYNIFEQPVYKKA